jgi:hypothetical protein
MHLGSGRRIHDLVERSAEQAVAVEGDDGAGQQRSPIIRALVALSSDEGDRDADKRRRRSDGVGAMKTAAASSATATMIPAMDSALPCP